MKNLSLLLFFCIWSTLNTVAQKRLIINPAKTCNASGRTADSLHYTFDASKEAENIVQQITSMVGIKQSFTVRACDVDNALACCSEESERYILYNEDFIQNLKKVTATKWSAYFILAHEIGHHLNGHTFGSNEVRPEKELEADEFAGNVLYKLGASLEETEAAVKALEEEKGSLTHPPTKTRIVAVARGWVHASEEVKPEKIKSECEQKQTGDYCFTNNTKHKFKIYLFGMGENRLPAKILTLDEGQTQCFYSLKAQPYEYNFEQTDRKPGSGISYDPASIMRGSGQIKVEACKSQTFEIKPKSNETEEIKVSAECEERKIGNCCFQNTTKDNYKIILHIFIPASQLGGMYTNTTKETMVDAGSTACLYDIPAGSFSCDLIRESQFSASSRKIELRVEKCDMKTYVIKW